MCLRTADMPHDDFEAVQSRFVERRQTNLPARVTTTNNLLIGVARWGCGGDGCGGGMNAVIGKSGRHQYYGCFNRARAGIGVCKGRRIPRSRPDNIVIDAFKQPPHSRAASRPPFGLA